MVGSRCCHFDSASVHRGIIGGLPRTMWVIDYPQLERIYYSLVAGYYVFGNVAHQTNIRCYMDFLRFEGEINFISYMPKEHRLPLIKSWYENTDIITDGIESKSYHRKTKIKYKTAYPKSEFIEKVVNNHILKSTNIKFDNINYYTEGTKPPSMPEKFNDIEDIIDGVRSLTAPGTGFIKHVTEGDVNNMLLRIIMPDGESEVFTIVVNRWHDNVNSLFGEQDRLNPDRDNLDFIPYSIGSYPNAFATVHYEDLPDFFDIIKNFDASDKYKKRFFKYFIRRSDDRFWKTFDWFQENFNRAEPVKSGLYDLNRYYHK